MLTQSSVCVEWNDIGIVSHYRTGPISLLVCISLMTGLKMHMNVEVGLKLIIYISLSHTHTRTFCSPSSSQVVNGPQYEPKSFLLISRDAEDLHSCLQLSELLCCLLLVFSLNTHTHINLLKHLLNLVIFKKLSILYSSTFE